MKKHPELSDKDAPDPHWVHPGDAMDAQEGRAEGDPEMLAAKQIALEMFRRLFADFMPSKTAYRGARRWKAGYNRMVAMAYVAAPSLFVGMTQARVAFALGIEARVFRRLQREAEASLAQRAQPRRRRGAS